METAPPQTTSDSPAQSKAKGHLRVLVAQYLLRLFVIAAVGLVFEPLINKDAQYKLKEWSKSQNDRVTRMSLWSTGGTFYDEIERGGVIPLRIEAVSTGSEARIEVCYSKQMNCFDRYDRLLSEPKEYTRVPELFNVITLPEWSVRVFRFFGKDRFPLWPRIPTLLNAPFAYLTALWRIYKESWFNGLVGSIGLVLGCMLAFSDKGPSKLSFVQTFTRLSLIPIVPAVLCALLQGVLWLVTIALREYAALPSLLVGLQYWSTIGVLMLKEREHFISHQLSRFLESKVVRFLFGQ